MVRVDFGIFCKGRYCGCANGGIPWGHGRHFSGQGELGGDHWL
jgi:hypothetical protein